MFDQIERNQMEMVLALRSGRYTQGFNDWISGENEYCFMGLAYRILIGELPDTKHLTKYAGDLFSFNIIILRRKLNIDRKQQGSLVLLNDAGCTFLELADILVKDHGFPDVYVYEPQLEEVAV